MATRHTTVHKLFLVVATWVIALTSLPIQAKKPDKFLQVTSLEQVTGLVELTSSDLVLFDFDRVLIPTRGKTWTKKAFDPAAPKVLKQIKLSGATLGGVTKRMPVKLGVLDKALEEMDVTFDWLDGVSEKFITGSRLRQGVLFTCFWSKGQCLESLFERKAFDKKGLPKRIVFIDDSQANLRSVRYFAEKHGIEFSGIWFDYHQTKSNSTSHKQRSKPL